MKKIFLLSIILFNSFLGLISPVFATEDYLKYPEDRPNAFGIKRIYVYKRPTILSAEAPQESGSMIGDIASGALSGAIKGALGSIGGGGMSVRQADTRPQTAIGAISQAAWKNKHKAAMGVANPMGLAPAAVPVIMGAVQGIMGGGEDDSVAVQVGVTKALVDTFGGYPEYQRRQITQEIVNSTFRSHYVTSSLMSFDQKEMKKVNRAFKNQMKKLKEAQERREENIFGIPFLDDVLGFMGEMGLEWSDIPGLSDMANLNEMLGNLDIEAALESIGVDFDFDGYGLGFTIPNFDLSEREMDLVVSITDKIQETVEGSINDAQDAVISKAQAEIDRANAAIQNGIEKIDDSMRGGMDRIIDKYLPSYEELIEQGIEIWRDPKTGQIKTRKTKKGAKAKDKPKNRYTTNKKQDKGMQVVNRGSHIGTENVDNAGDRILEAIGFDLQNSSNGTKANVLSQIMRLAFYNEHVNDLQDLFKYCATFLLLLVIILVVIQRLGSGDISHTFGEPFVKGLIIYSLILLCKPISHFMMAIFIAVADMLMDFVSGNPVANYNDFDINVDHIRNSWELIANSIGYMPVFILSILDSIAQFLFYFFVGGVFLHIVVGKILMPVWLVSFMSNKIEAHATQSIINWLKSMGTLAAIPVIYLSSNLLIASFATYSTGFLVISLSIASFLYIPLISNMMLASGQAGIFKPLFGGYQVMIDTINSSLTNVRNVIELEKARNV